MMDKKQLRNFYKSVRKTISPNERIDFNKKILTFLINSDLYINSDLLLIYVSVNDEADTYEIISRALNDGKKVGIPYCIGKEMKFLLIDSLNELSEGEFGIPSADSKKCKEVTVSDNTVCFVPGLCFDSHGNRLGYGGGFYDRYLNKNKVETVGLCYGRCCCDILPSNEYDIPVKYILTENGIKKF